MCTVSYKDEDDDYGYGKISSVFFAVGKFAAAFFALLQFWVVPGEEGLWASSSSSERSAEGVKCCLCACEREEPPLEELHCTPEEREEEVVC